MPCFRWLHLNSTYLKAIDHLKNNNNAHHLYKYEIRILKFQILDLLVLNLRFLCFFQQRFCSYPIGMSLYIYIYTHKYWSICPGWWLRSIDAVKLHRLIMDETLRKCIESAFHIARLIYIFIYIVLLSQSSISCYITCYLIVMFLPSEQTIASKVQSHRISCII